MLKFYYNAAPNPLKVALFLEERLKPVHLEEADLRAHLKTEYRPGQERR